MTGTGHLSAVKLGKVRNGNRLTSKRGNFGEAGQALSLPRLETIDRSRGVDFRWKGGADYRTGYPDILQFKAQTAQIRDAVARRVQTTAEKEGQMRRENAELFNFRSIPRFPGKLIRCNKKLPSDQAMKPNEDNSSSISNSSLPGCVKLTEGQQITLARTRPNDCTENLNSRSPSSLIQLPFFLPFAIELQSLSSPSKS